MELKEIFIVKILYKSGVSVSMPFVKFTVQDSKISWTSINHRDFQKIDGSKYQNFCYSPLQINADEIASIFLEDVVYLNVPKMPV